MVIDPTYSRMTIRNFINNFYLNTFDNLKEKILSNTIYKDGHNNPKH